MRKPRTRKLNQVPVITQSSQCGSRHLVLGCHFLCVYEILMKVSFKLFIVMLWKLRFVNVKYCKCFKEPWRVRKAGAPPHPLWPVMEGMSIYTSPRGLSFNSKWVNRGLTRNKIGWNLDLGLLPTELWENKFTLLKLPSPWYPVTAA